ncbi:MAG: acylglycerol kinase family protein, partial [Lachnospiraceae bacterium]|nr:acylglycerol kinase family protein [Lachnospiraceae bacterium]
MIYFIVNESSKSGKSKEIVNDVVGIFKKNGIEYKPAITKYEGHACEIAEKIVKKEYTDFLSYKENPDENFKTQIIVLGGDGTINEVVNGIMNAKNESEEIYKFADEHL